MPASETNIVIAMGYALCIPILIAAFLQIEARFRERKEKALSRDEPVVAIYAAAFADFPEPPDGMPVHVLCSERGVKITWFRVIPAALNNAQKCGYLLVLAPLFFSLGLAFLFSLIHVLFPDAVAVAFSPGWTALNLILLLLDALLSLACMAAVAGLMIGAYRLTPERPYWELELSPRRWCASLARPNHDESEPSTEVRELLPSHVTHLGVDVGGRVYCEVVPESKDEGKSRVAKAEPRVELTPMLSKAEAAWLEQALRFLLSLS